MFPQLIGHGNELTSLFFLTTRLRSQLGDMRKEKLLMYATANGFGVLAKWFIDRGADVTATDREGWTPLHRASE